MSFVCIQVHAHILILELISRKKKDKDIAQGGKSPQLGSVDHYRKYNQKQFRTNDR